MTNEERINKMEKAVALITETMNVLYDLDDEEDKDEVYYDESLDIAYSAIRQANKKLHKVQYLMIVGLRDFENTT